MTEKGFYFCIYFNFKIFVEKFIFYLILHRNVLGLSISAKSTRRTYYFLNEDIFKNIYLKSGSMLFSQN